MAEDHLIPPSGEDSGPTEWRSRLPIVGEGRYTSNDFWQFIWVRTSRTKGDGRDVAFLFLGGGLLVIVLNAMKNYLTSEQLPGPAPTTAGVATWFPFFIVFLVLFLLYLFHEAKKTHLSTNGECDPETGRFEPRTFSVDENRILEDSIIASHSYQWSDITEVICNNHLYALGGQTFGTNSAPAWVILPRRFFDDADWAAIQSLVQEKSLQCENLTFRYRDTDSL